MEKAFQIGAVVLLGIAAVFFVLGNSDGVFISIVFACLSFFLSVRTQVKKRLKARAEEGSGEHLMTDGELEEAEVPDLAQAETESDSVRSDR